MYLPKVIFIEGRPGKGKTLCATYLALLHQEEYGLKIFSNTKLNPVARCLCEKLHTLENESFYCPVQHAEFERSVALEILTPETIYLPRFKDFYDLLKADEEAEGTVLGGASLIFDEVQKFLDSRRSGSKMNMLLNQMTGDFRKRQLDIYATGHSKRDVDKRFLRKVTHFIVPLLNEKKDLCVMNITDAETSRVYRASFKPSSVFPYYKTVERPVAGGKYTRMKGEDLA